MSIDESWRSLRSFADSQHGVFRSSDAAACGISAKRLRRAITSGHLHRLAHGVYGFTPTAPSPLQPMMAASLVGGMASHGSSAHLHRLAGFENIRRVDVSFRRGRRVRIAGAIVHTWSHDDRGDVAEVEGIRFASIARTLLQLGAYFDEATVELAMDSALARGANLEWIVETRRRLHRPGVTGSGTLGRVLADPERVIGVESPLERRLADALVAAGLPPPVPQLEIRTPGGRFRADFAYPGDRLLIEAHSMKFHPSGRPDRDMRRHLALTAAGWEVVYVTHAMLADPESFIPQIRAVLRRHDRC